MRVSFWLKNLVIFLSLFAMVYWFYMLAKNTSYDPVQTKPQEYMNNLNSVKYGIDGKPKEEIRADYWEFDPNRGCSDLSKPLVTVHKPNGEIWYLAANKALAWHPTLTAKISKIDMLEGVVIERPAVNSATPVKLETLALQYNPEQETINTNEYVSMQQPGLKIGGQGLSGYLDRNWIELHDKITTTYTPM